MNRLEVEDKPLHPLSSSRCGRGAVRSLGPPDREIILTFYQVRASSYAADNLNVAPPLNWVVREEADAILAISEDIKISTGSGRRGAPGGENPLTGAW